MITITTALRYHVASFMENILAGESSRDNVRANGTLIQLNITGYQSGEGGRLAVTVASSAAYFEVNDTVVISGATGTLAKYNGRHEVFSVASGVITLATLWQGGTSAAVGQITRSNDSLLIRADVYKGETLLGSVYATPSKQAWRMDVSRTLQLGHYSPFTLTPGLASADGTVYSYEVRLFEQWQKTDYTTIIQQTISATQTGVAHRVTSVDPRTTGQMLNTTYLAGGSLVMHIMGDFVQARVRFTPSNGLPTTYNADCPNGHIVAVYPIPSGIRWVMVEVLDVDTPTRLKDPLIIRVLPIQCGKRLYFLNRLGGYASVELVDYQIYDEVERIERTPVKVLEVVRASSQQQAREALAYLDGLADSPEVYDELGRRVYLRTANVIKWANEAVLDVEFEREQNSML